MTNFLGSNLNTTYNKYVMKTILWKANGMSNIIDQRLQLQSTQKGLEEFDIYIPDVHSLKGVLKSFRQWDQKKQNKFIRLIGGAANFNKTEEFIKEL